MESVYFEEFYGEQEGLYNLYNDSNAYMRESDNRYARPIVTNKYDSSWDMYDKHSYPGGATRIRMLRSMIGDEKFWEAVTDYLKTFKGKAAETIDFQRKLEKHSGLSLGSFFEQWLYKPGYPKLKAEFNYDGDNKLASIKIEQTQIDEKKHIEGFKFPLDIIWETDDGKFEGKTFQIEEDKIQNFYFKCDKKPLQIRLDPDYKMLFSLDFNPGDELLIRQLESVNVIGKILAAKELVKEGKKKNIQIVAENFKNEEFWGLKIEYSKALAGSASFDGVKALLTLLEEEKDPLVLRPMISELTGKKHEIVFEAMKKFLQRDDKPIRATSAALNVIGSQRTEKAFNFLSTYEITYDSKSIVKSGLFTAMGRIRSEKSIEYLLSRRTYGLEPKSARVPLVMAIVDSLIWAKKNVRDRGIEMLTDLLQTEKEEQMIRILALQLGKFNDPSVIPSINSAKSRIAEGDRPQLNRLIEKIGKGATTEEETKKLRKELNELKSKISKILARIEKMEAKDEIKKEK
jgi:aminopeptidase N